MVEIAVVSDSHIPTRADSIPSEFWERIESADITVHAGDFDREETFNAVEEYSNEFYAVKGNCDFFEEDELKQSQTFETEGLQLGVYHGTGITPRGDQATLEKIARKDLEVDVLIHGHTHQEEISEGERLLINPGSCTGVGGGSSRDSEPTMMILELKDDKLNVNILEKDEEVRVKTSETFKTEELKEK